jgi:hypothetical protein
MDRALIAAASAKLDLLDIALDECSLARDPDLDPLAMPVHFRQQRSVAYKIEELEYQQDQAVLSILRAYISLGSRAVPETDEHDGSVKPYFEIRATFRADYEVKDKLTERQIAEFCEHNAVHNVWPFWRAHVFQILKAAELPPLRIPLLRPLTKKPGQSRIAPKIPDTASTKKEPS